MKKTCPVSWGSIIDYLCRGVRLLNECPAYGTNKSDSEASVNHDFGGLRSKPSLSLLPSPLRPRIVAPDRVLSMGQI